MKLDEIYDQKKVRYLKACLRIETDCHTDNRNNEEILEYIDQLERAVMSWQPPKAETINPSAREMIDSEATKVAAERFMDQYGQGKLHGLEFALDCLDKPAKPMVSVAEVIKEIEALNEGCFKGNALNASSRFSIWFDKLKEAIK